MANNFFVYHTKNKYEPRKYRVYENRPKEPTTVLESLTIAQLCASQNCKLTPFFIPTEDPVMANSKPTESKPTEPKPTESKPVEMPPRASVN